jgi:hypothetical protein
VRDPTCRTSRASTASRTGRDAPTDASTRLRLAVDFIDIDEPRVVAGQLVVALEDIVTQEKRDVGADRLVAEVDRRRRPAARSRPDEVGDVVDRELSLRESRSRAAIIPARLSPRPRTETPRPQ